MRSTGRAGEMKWTENEDKRRRRRCDRFVCRCFNWTKKAALFDQRESDGGTKGRKRMEGTGRLARGGGGREQTVHVPSDGRKRTTKRASERKNGRQVSGKIWRQDEKVAWITCSAKYAKATKLDC